MAVTLILQPVGRVIVVVARRGKINVRLLYHIHHRLGSRSLSNLFVALLNSDATNQVGEATATEPMDEYNIANEH